MKLRCCARTPLLPTQVFHRLLTIGLSISLSLNLIVDQVGHSLLNSEKTRIEHIEHMDYDGRQC